MIIQKQHSNIPEIGINELEVIFQDIIPPQLRETSPVLYDLFFLFLRYIEPTTRISFDINFKNNDDFDTIDLKTFKRNIIHMFLNTFSVNFYKALDDTEVINDLKKFLSTIDQDFVEIDRDFPFNDGFNFTEDLMIFSQKAVTDKGKANPYYYYSKLLSKTKLVFDDDSNFFINVEEGDEPFKYKIEGSIRRILFNKIVKPLSHPVGFSYDYINRIYNNFEEMFDVLELQSNFVVKISKGTKILDFSEGVSYIYLTKDISGKNNYLISYVDGSYIKKDGTGKIVFYSNDNSILTVLEKAELSVRYDRKFSTRITSEITENSNKNLATNFWLYKKCWVISDDQKIGEDGLKICSISVNEGYVKEKMEFSERNYMEEDVTPAKFFGNIVKIKVGTEYSKIYGNIIDFAYSQHFPFAIDEFIEKISSSLVSDIDLTEEVQITFDYFGKERFYLHLNDWIIGEKNMIIGQNNLKIQTEDQSKFYLESQTMNFSCDFDESFVISEETQSNGYQQIIENYELLETLTNCENNFRMYEKMIERHYLGEGIKLNDPKIPIIVLRFENILFPTSTIDVEIIHQ